MKYVYLSYIKIVQYVETVKSIYEIPGLAVSFILLMVLGFSSANHAISVWSGILAGFIFGIMLLKLPGAVTYYKNSKRKSVN